MKIFKTKVYIDISMTALLPSLHKHQSAFVLCNSTVHNFNELNNETSLVLEKKKVAVYRVIYRKHLMVYGTMVLYVPLCFSVLLALPLRHLGKTACRRAF